MCDKYLECGGCSCHTGHAPCSHCEQDHNNVDSHPICEFCDEVMYEDTEIEILKHKVNCFELE